MLGDGFPLAVVVPVRVKLDEEDCICDTVGVPVVLGDELWLDVSTWLVDCVPELVRL